jgi:hypothetical protein
MSFLVFLVLPFLLCLGMATVTSLLWRLELQNPGLYAVAGFLATLGLHRLLQAGAELTKLFIPGGYFLESRPKPDIVQLAKETLNTETVVLSVLLVAIGVPLLRWLKAAMVKV